MFDFLYLLLSETIRSNKTRHSGITKDKRKVAATDVSQGCPTHLGPELESIFAFPETSCLIKLRPSFFYIKTVGGT